VWSVEVCPSHMLSCVQEYVAYIAYFALNRLRTHAHTHTHIHTRMHTTHTRTHAYTYTHTHTHTHTHTNSHRDIQSTRLEDQLAALHSSLLSAVASPPLTLSQSLPQLPSVTSLSSPLSSSSMSSPGTL
jgi:hypothetical protein